MNHHPLSFALATALLALACSKSEAPAPGASSTSAGTGSPAAATATSAPAAADPKAAKEAYETRCAPCHGTSGKGDGPGAAALNPKPRNYSDKAWQASVTDEQIRKTIVYGGAAVNKSPIMPASPDLDGKPELVDGLVKIVRGFGQ